MRLSIISLEKGTALNTVIEMLNVQNEECVDGKLYLLVYYCHLYSLTVFCAYFAKA